LKYGDERKLLETLQLLIDHLLLIVRNVDFTWDSFFEHEQQVARDFWELNGRRTKCWMFRWGPDILCDCSTAKHFSFQSCKPQLSAFFWSSAYG